MTQLGAFTACPVHVVLAVDWSDLREAEATSAELGQHDE